MTVTTIPSPRLRPSRIIPAVLATVGLAVGATAAVLAIDDGSSVNRSPAAVSVPEASSHPLSADAAEHSAISRSHDASVWSATSGLPASPAASELLEATRVPTSHQVATWSATSGLPASPAASELLEATASEDTLVRFGPR